MDFRFRWKSGRAADITSKTGFAHFGIPQRSSLLIAEGVLSSLSESTGGIGQ